MYTFATSEACTFTVSSCVTVSIGVSGVTRLSARCNKSALSSRLTERNHQHNLYRRTLASCGVERTKLDDLRSQAQCRSCWSQSLHRIVQHHRTNDGLFLFGCLEHFSLADADRGSEAWRFVYYYSSSERLARNNPYSCFLFPVLKQSNEHCSRHNFTTKSHPDSSYVRLMTWTHHQPALYEIAIPKPKTCQRMCRRHSLFRSIFNLVPSYLSLNQPVMVCTSWGFKVQNIKFLGKRNVI